MSGFGGLLGAAANLTTALSKEKSLKSFLSNVDKVGIQVKNNYEINFSGLGQITFFCQSINVPGVRNNFTELYFEGRKFDIPIYTDYDHEFTMTVINDASGYIYSAIVSFLMSNAFSTIANSGYTMTIKALTGDKHWKGTLYTLRGVRFESVGQLHYGQGDNDISIFDLNLKCVDFSVTPGALAKAAGIAGTVTSLIS